MIAVVHFIIKLRSIHDFGCCRGRYHMAVGFTTTCAISPYHLKSCESEPRTWLGVRVIALCDNVCR